MFPNNYILYFSFNNIGRKSFLFSKIIIWSEKLGDNKCNTFLSFWFKLLFYSQNMSLNNFPPIETKINKKFSKKKTKPNI